VLSGRGLCVGLITRSAESYRVWCVWVWSWSLDNEDALAQKGCCAMGKRKYAQFLIFVHVGQIGILRPERFTLPRAGL
jgi:hypothetical protein